MPKNIENFLTRSRSGHCEYFATATVLLLRQAGIPARYARGYSV
ncbi:MAG: transglutaminase-like domain-containing protein, partial [Deltaproteobacteria bacterium]|nr:transglutaminase-like domain-containing protein [Deltaproteobacteria bacterium]